MQVIALHTFVVLFWAKNMNALSVARFVVIFLWVVTGVVAAAISATHRRADSNFYAPVRVSLACVLSHVVVPT